MKKNNQFLKILAGFWSGLVAVTAVFWKFMIKPNKKNKISKWKFILLAVALLVAYYRVTTYLNRPIIARDGAETVAFSVNGEYVESDDIKSGTYYMVLTDSEDESISVSVRVYYNGLYSYGYYSEIGETERIAIPKGSIVEVDGDNLNYEVTFFTEEDYVEQNIKDKYLSKETLVSTTQEVTKKEEPVTSTPVAIDVNEFIKKYDEGSLDTSLVYQFDAEPSWHQDWGLDADGVEYSIFIKGHTYEDFIIFTNERVANSIRNSNLVTFTVRIDTTSTTYIEPVRVISAIPKS